MKKARGALADARWMLFERRCRRTRACLVDMTRSQLNYAVNISPSRRYVLVNNPKTGLTSVKSALIAIECGEQDQPSSPHDMKNDPFLRLTQLRTTAPLEHLVRRDYRFVTMVRNPYTRLVSAYRSTIFRHRDVEDPRRARWLESLGLPTSRVAPVSFDEFVAIVAAQPDRDMNPHWRTQVSQVLYHQVPYWFIGRFENFDQDMELLIEKIGVSAGLAPARRHLNRSGRQADLSDWYTDGLAKVVAQRYRGDFEAFGYSNELE